MGSEKLGAFDELKEALICSGIQRRARTQVLMMSRVNLLPGVSLHIIWEVAELRSLPFRHLEYSLAIVNMI